MNGEPRYFLTAYGIARKYGFEGSEEEWLRSLVGPVPVLSIGQVNTLPAGMPAYVEISGEAEAPVLVFGIPRGEGTEDALMKTGGMMMGMLDMNMNRIVNLPEPQGDGDAVRLAYVKVIAKAASDAGAAASKAQEMGDEAKQIADAALARAGGEMTGPLMVLAPAADNHAANRKYVDDKAASLYLSARVQLKANNWEGSGPYTQTLAVEGMRYTDKPHYGVIYSDDLASALKQKDAFALVDDLDSADGGVTFTCFEEPPDVDLTIMLEVNR